MQASGMLFLLWRALSRILDLVQPQLHDAHPPICRIASSVHKNHPSPVPYLQFAIAPTTSIYSIERITLTAQPTFRSQSFPRTTTTSGIHSQVSSSDPAVPSLPGKLLWGLRSFRFLDSRVTASSLLR